MRRVFVGHSRDGFSLRVLDAPRWAYAVEAVAGSWVGSWTWRFPPLWDAWQWLMSTSWRHKTAEWRIPLDEATALEMSEPGTWNYVHAEDGGDAS